MKNARENSVGSSTCIAPRGVYSKRIDNVQLYLAIGVPIVFNGLMFTVLAVMTTSRMAALDSRMSGIESRMTALENTLNTRFDLMMGRLMELDTRLTRLEERTQRQ